MHEKQSIWKKLISRTLGNKKTQSVTIPVFCVLIGLIAGAVVIAVLGKNPFSAYYNLLQGCGLAPKASYAGYKSILTDFLSFLNYLTPMIFAALAVAVAMRTGLFNIGVSGQMLAAGFLSSILIGYSGLNAVLSKPLVLLIGILAGALVGGLIGLLKYKFNINEVVSSIMLNYIIQYVCSFCINTFLCGSGFQAVKGHCPGGAPDAGGYGGGKSENGYPPGLCPGAYSCVRREIPAGQDQNGV